MKSRQRLFLLIALLLIGICISAWVNVPPWLVRRRAAEHYRHGLEYERKGEMENALAEWRIAASIDRDYPEPYHKLADFLLNKADRPDLAAENLRLLTAIDPNGPHVYCNLAQALAVQNEMAEARLYAEMAVKAEPDCPLAHNIHGVILMTDQKARLGLKELERACELAPNNAQYALVLAKAYLDTSDLAGAQRVLEGVLKREPGKAEAHYLMGWAYNRGPRVPENVEKALFHFREATRLQPDDADSYSEWGKLLLQTGRAEEARQALEKAWELNPRLVQVANNLITAYRRLGQEQQAQRMEKEAQRLIERSDRLRVLQKRRDVNPRDVDTILQLAEVELEDGNLTDALRYVQGYLQQHPADRRALQLLAKVYAVGGKPDLAESVQQHLRSLPGTAPR